MLALIGMVSEPTTVQFTPSTDVEAVRMSACRSIATHSGAATAGPVVLTLAPPVTGRRWNAVPLPGDTSISAWAAPALSESRIITPALVQALTFCTLATRATMRPLPASVW